MKVALAMAFLLFTQGCTRPNQTRIPEAPTTANPFVGTWAYEETGEAIHFLSTGALSIEPGEILASLNRLQNTQRARYTSRLINRGRYEISDSNDLILYVTADWTGKGTGARRPTYKQVESTIIFEYEIENRSILRLKKKSLTQGAEENLNPNEELQLLLTFIE